MLTSADFAALSQSVKGWNRKKLREYGVEWPPEAGWRKRLLREYTDAKGPTTASRGGSRMLAREKMPLWKKYRPNSDEEIETLLNNQRHLTAEWYQRMCGNVAWKPGEKEMLSQRWESAEAAITRLRVGRELGGLSETQKNNLLS